MTPHAFRHEPRKKLTDQQRAKLFLDKGGRCHKCTRVIFGGETWFAEHLIALQNGGTNADGNWEVTCSNCFPIKNAEDAGKAKRMRKAAVRHIVPTKQRENYGSFKRPKNSKFNWRRQRYEPIATDTDEP